MDLARINWFDVLTTLDLFNSFAKPEIRIEVSSCSGMTLARLLSLLLALATTVSIAEAQNTTGRSARTKSVSQQPAARDQNSNAALSEQECRAYAQALTKAFSSGDRAALSALIDWDSIFDTALNGLSMPDNQRREFTTGLRSSLDNDNGFTGQLVKNGPAGGKFDYLRTRQNNGRQVVLMRMIQGKEAGEVGYFEFVPKKFADGKTRRRFLCLPERGVFLGDAPPSLAARRRQSVANFSRQIADQ